MVGGFGAGCNAQRSWPPVIVGAITVSGMTRERPSPRGTSCVPSQVEKAAASACPSTVLFSRRQCTAQSTTPSFGPSQRASRVFRNGHRPSASSQKAHIAMLRLPSGPPPLPLVGNLLDIGMGKGIGLGPQPHVRMTTLAEQYGDVMALRMGGAEPEPWVVLSSPAAVHDAFVARGGDFSGRPMVSSMAVSSGGGQGFAQPTMTKRLRELRGLAFSTLFGAAAVEQAEMKLQFL